MFADLSDRAKFRLTGPDRVRYLNGQVTANVAKLRAGQSAYALVCNAKGRIEGDVFVHATDDALLVDAPAVLREPLLARLGKYLIADDCEWADVTDDFRLGHEIRRAEETALFAEDGAHLFPDVARFGPLGTDLWLPVSAAPLASIVTPDELDLLRLEHAVPVWGAELTPDVFPQEAGLEDRAVDFHKGCYVGQEVVSRLRSVGQVNRRLRALEAVDDGGALRPGLRLFAVAEDGGAARDVGVLTSVRWHPQWQKMIALGYVRRTVGPEAGPLRAGPAADNLGGTLRLRPTPADTHIH